MWLRADKVSDIAGREFLFTWFYCPIVNLTFYDAKVSYKPSFVTNDLDQAGFKVVLYHNMPSLVWLAFDVWCRDICT